MVAIPLAFGLVDVLIVLLFIVVGVVLAFFLAPPLAGMFRKIPFVGPSIAVAVEVLLLDQQVAIRAWVAQHVGPAQNLFQALSDTANKFLNIAIAYGVATVQALQNVSTAAGGSAGNVATRLQNLAQQVAGLVGTVGTITSTVGTIVGQIARIIANTIPAMIAQAVAAVTAAWQAGVRVEHGFATAGIAAATQLAQALYAQAVIAAQAGDIALTHLLSHTAATLAAEIVAVQTGAKTYTDTRVGPLSQEIQDIIKVVIPASVIPLGLSITQIATQVDTLERECISPTCAALDAGLDLFKLLQAGIELLLIVGLLQAATSNPTKAGHDLAAGVGELVALARPVLDAVGVKV